MSVSASVKRDNLVIVTIPRKIVKSKVINLKGGQLSREMVVGSTPLLVKLLVARVGNQERTVAPAADMQWVLQLAAIPHAVTLHLLTSVPAGLTLALLSRLVVTVEIPQVDYLARVRLSRICPRGVFSCRQSSPCWKPGWRV